MSLLIAVKTWGSKQLVKLIPSLGKSLLNSLMGKNKGEVVVHRKEGNNNVICFIHGFNGSPRQTFGEFPILINSDPAFKGWDIFSIGFATDMLPTIQLGLWAELPDITKLSKFLATNITTGLGDYKQIAIVAHSMGGLVAQRAILDLPVNERSRITYLLLYGTPSNGLHKAKFAKWLHNIQVNDMAYGGPFITKLRKEWSDTFATTPFVFATVAGELDVFVPVESSQQPFSSGHATTIGNHIDMVKPDSVDHTSYAILKKTIINKTPYLQTFSSQALNNLMGNYSGIINSLSSQLATIGRREFREYIFALEGYRDVDSAIQALENSDRVLTDTDFMGILGGRYKRRFLSAGQEADKIKAIQLYTKGYEMSNKKNDSKQVFFHSINLAFLYLYGDNDREKMKQFASEAVKHVKLSNYNDMWEDATMAEAHLYLNNFDGAKESYMSAIKKAGNDERSVSSMYLNAYYACVALDRNDWTLEIDKLFKRN